MREVRPLLLAAEIARPVRTSFGVMARRHALLVEVLTDAGLTGLGEIWCNFPPWVPADRIALLRSLAPALAGADPSQPAAIWERLVRAHEVLGLQWGAPGPVRHVLSGIDTAMWDIAAQAAGVPLHRLLGGPPCAAVPVYASGLGPEGGEELAARHRDRGVTAFKLKVGFGAAQDLAAARRLRDAVGSRARLMVDANQAWTPRQAVAAIAGLAACGLHWVEEPVRCDDLRGLAEVRRAAGVPTAAGENLYGLPAAHAAVTLGAVDVLQPDVSKTGGVTESLAVARLAAASGTGCALHFLGGAVGLVASAHVAAAAAGGPLWLELDANPNPLREGLLAEPPAVRDGALRLPQGGGLGIALDPAAVRRYRVDP